MTVPFKCCLMTPHRGKYSCRELCERRAELIISLIILLLKELMSKAIKYAMFFPLPLKPYMRPHKMDVGETVSILYGLASI
jgi:hypothetical protein